MSHQLQRLYRSVHKTKLTLLAVIAVVSGGFVLFLTSWAKTQPGWEWLTALPAVDLGSALFTTGLIVVAFEYLNRENAEAEAMHRLRTVLTEQAPAIRDAVIQGFAFNADDLANVASPATLDRVVRNSLAIQLGDRALADDVYTDLRQQVIRASERWHDVHVSVALSPWEHGPASGEGAMFVAAVRWKYRVTLAGSTMRFSCVSDPDDYRELLQDPATTAAWHFPPIAGLDGASDEAFALVQFAIEGKQRPIRRTTRKGAQTFTVNLGTAAGAPTEEVTLSYTYRVLVQKSSHLLYLDFAKPAKGLKVEFWYGDCGIRFVNILDLIASSTQTRISRSPASVPTPQVEVGFDGWVFPRSGVAFVWVMEEEMKRIDRFVDSSAPATRE